MKRVISNKIPSGGREIILNKDYMYDTVDNLLDACWKDVLNTCKSHGFIDDEDRIIIPKGTTVYVEDDDEVTPYYVKMCFENGDWIPVLKEDVITIIDASCSTRSKKKVEASREDINYFGESASRKYGDMIAKALSIEANHGWMVNHPGYDLIGGPTDPWPEYPETELEKLARKRLEDARREHGAPADANFDGAFDLFAHPDDEDLYWNPKTHAYDLRSYDYNMPEPIRP